MFLGCLDGVNEDKIKISNKNWIEKTILICFVTCIMFINIKNFVTHIIVDKTINVRTSFEQKYNIYEKCNKFLPYNSDYKIKKIKLIEAYAFKYPDRQDEFSKKILQYTEYLMKNEKYYEKFEMQSRLILNSLELIETDEKNKMINNIEMGFELIKNYKPIERNYLRGCYLKKQKISEIAGKILEKSNIVSDEEIKRKLKEFSKKFYLLNVEEYEKDIEYLNNTTETVEFGKEYFFEIFNKYKDEAEEKVKEI